MSDKSVKVVSTRKVCYGDKCYLAQRPTGVWHLETSYETHDTKALGELRACIDEVLRTPNDAQPTGGIDLGAHAVAVN